MSDSWYSINGKIVPEAEAVIPATDRGFLYGDGLFETIHAYGMTLFRLESHLERLIAGAQTLHFSPAPDANKLREQVKALVQHAGFTETNVRLTVTRGCGPRGPSTLHSFEQNVVISATKHARPSIKRLTEGVTAVMATFRRQEAAATASMKTLNYIEQILAKREAELAGADEALLLNNAGLLCEGSASNISLIREGALLIPDPARSGALPGIAQLTAIEAAQNLRIPVKYLALSPWDPLTADEVFLTGSLREITPMVKLGNSVTGGGKPGPLTLQIAAEYRRIIERECAPFRFPSEWGASDAA